MYHFSAPGRFEIGGNHTDHQRGRVLAAAVDLQTRCAAVANGTDMIRVTSEGFGHTSIDLSDLAPREDETGTTAALIRGVAAWFVANGHHIGGFDANVSSELPVGMGLSSSAAFEVLIGNAFKCLFQSQVSELEIALAGQFAENVYFGKPCGLMDQAASSFGGLTMMDFFDPQKPVITPVCADFEGFSICVVATGGSHEDLTDDYAAIPAEMKAVAAHFGKHDLRAVDERSFYSSIGELRRLGDRAVLRAMHFFGENERVARQAEALNDVNMPEFLRLVTESGRSSLAFLQNVYSNSVPSRQGLTLALALCERVLGGSGAFRVHGGGFAGTVLAFVPDALRERFISIMSDAFGPGCCLFLNIAQEGGRSHAPPGACE